MILGGTLAGEVEMKNPMAFVFFPIMIHAFDIIVSSCGIMNLGRVPFGYGTGDRVVAMLEPGFGF